MPSKQVQIFVPLLCRSETTGLSVVIQAPTSTPAHHTQPAASLATAAGDTDPVLEVMAVLGIFHRSDPWRFHCLVRASRSLVTALGERKFAESSVVGQAHVSHCSVWDAKAGGKQHMPSSSTVSTVGDDRAKCTQNKKKGRKLRACEVASYRAKYSCFRV